MTLPKQIAVPEPVISDHLRTKVGSATAIGIPEAGLTEVRGSRREEGGERHESREDDLHGDAWGGYRAVASLRWFRAVFS